MQKRLKKVLESLGRHSKMSEVFRVIIEGDYRAGQAFEMIIKQTGVVKTQIESMSRAAQQMSVESTVNYEGMARSLLRVTSLFAIMDMAMMRVQVAHNILESSQERYNYALEKHGPTSRQAAQAQRELERVQNYVARSYIRASVSALSFTVNLLVQSKALEANTLATIGQTIVTKAAAIVEWWHNAALATKIILLSGLTAGIFAVTAAFGMMAAKTALAKQNLEGLVGQYRQLEGTLPSGQISIGRYAVPMRGITIEGAHFHVEKSIDEAADEYAKYIKSEYRRRTPE